MHRSSTSLRGPLHSNSSALHPPSHAAHPQALRIHDSLPRRLALTVTVLAAPFAIMKTLQNNLLPGPLRPFPKLSRMALHNIKQRVNLPSLQPNRFIQSRHTTMQLVPFPLSDRGIK